MGSNILLLKIVKAIGKNEMDFLARYLSRLTIFVKLKPSATTVLLLTTAGKYILRHDQRFKNIISTSVTKNSFNILR